MKVRKILLIAGTGLIFILCLAGFVFAYQAYADASKVKATLGGTFKTLEGIYKANPFPGNATNVTVLRSDTAWTTNWYESLVRELREAAMPTETLSSSGFIQKLQDTGAELQKKAAAEGSKVLADGFGFGFENYLGSKSAMPKPENVKRLAVQFTMVEAITRELLDSHIANLSRIDRDKFEGDLGEAPAVISRHRVQGGNAPAAAGTHVADSHYPGQHFALYFTADEKALAEVLGRLAKMPMFVVVTELKAERGERGLLPRPEKTTGETNKTAIAIAPRSQRIVSGPEVAPLLKIQLQIDVYTFEGV